MKLSLAYWCFNAFGPHWSIDQMSDICKSLGIEGIELAPPELWQQIHDAGLEMPLGLISYPSNQPAPFERGWNDTSFHAKVSEATRALITAPRPAPGFAPLIIAFSGNTVAKQSTETSMKNCATGITGLADELRAAQLCLSFEALNDKIPVAMKGHPGYEATQQRYSRTVALASGGVCGCLFDVYHRQVQEGSVERSLRFGAGVINHIHVAGCDLSAPRGALNLGTQALDWRANGALIREVCPNVFTGIEYIPNDGADHLEDLKRSVALLRGE